MYVYFLILAIEFVKRKISRRNIFFNDDNDYNLYRRTVLAGSKLFHYHVRDAKKKYHVFSHRCIRNFQIYLSRLGQRKPRFRCSILQSPSFSRESGVTGWLQ